MIIGNHNSIIDRFPQIMKRKFIRLIPLLDNNNLNVFKIRQKKRQNKKYKDTKMHQYDRIFLILMSEKNLKIRPKDQKH